MATQQDEDMYLFQSNYEQTPDYTGSTFDQFLEASPVAPDAGDEGTGFMNPNDLMLKRESEDGLPQLGDHKATRSPPSSSGSSRSSSSSIPTKRHLRHVSEASTTSQAEVTPRDGAWGSGINGLSMPSGNTRSVDATMSGFEDDFTASNEQMTSDFDFDTAASTPSGLDMTSSNAGRTPKLQKFAGLSAYTTGLVTGKGQTSRVPTGHANFYFGSRETSPLNAMLPVNQAQSPWTKNSPSSGLEETFNGITMDGDSPGNATFSPHPHFPSNGFMFETDSSATPSTLGKVISSPPSTVMSGDGGFHLRVLPTSLKSRVETQIPIKLILSPLPIGAKKLRLPPHTISKPKFLSKVEIQRSSEVLELYTALVCSSAMQDPVKLNRAFSRARGEDLPALARPSPVSSTASQSSRDEDEKPINGGEVRICSGCIQRERKRASRKKLKKPDEEELFQKDEEKRVVVFNTNELKDWVEATNILSSEDQSPGAESFHPPRPGSMQVELPMRIACYCRHQNEKIGFQVIFTIKDHRDHVIAQAITNSIMITDDHKTHNPPPQQHQTPPPPLPQAPQYPGAGVFSTSGQEYIQASGPGSKAFKQSFSTTDLHGLQHNFNPAFPMAPAPQPFAIPTTQSAATSATLTPRNLSRPASPSGPSGPTTKRRKQSGSGKLPSNLTMTRLETMSGTNGHSTASNSGIGSPFAPSSYTVGPDRGFAFPAVRSGQIGTSPPTPNSHENTFLSGINRSFSLENLPRQAIISAPSSRHPSRPSSPGSNRNSFGGGNDLNLGQAVSNHLLGQTSRRPPPIIHKLVPAEGSIAGGTEVTLLGHGFYQGLEVMFGDTEATTTTYWGDKCLNCITPPALQPGMVTVLFKHEHPHFGAINQQPQARHPIFTYTDDREVEMYRLALKSLGSQLPHPTDNPYAAAQQLLNSGAGTGQSMWGTQGSYNASAGHQMRGLGPLADLSDPLELETNMLRFLVYSDLKTPPSSNANLDITRASGLTLLHFASSLGLTRFVAGLLSRGANPNLLDRNGNTSMHHAAMNGHTHIIHRLRLAGADNRIRNIRNFLPADLATSLLSHQASLLGRNHYRSRSTGATPLRLHSRNHSSRSLQSFWEHESTNYSFSEDLSDSDSDSSSDEPAENTIGNVALPHRPMRHVSSQAKLTTDQRNGIMTTPSDGTPVSSATYMWAWRNSLAEQIQHFQQSAQWVMPNLPGLPNLPALSAIPDYQTHSVVRRVSSLFPQRPASRPGSTPPKEGWWESLTGTSSPPSSAAPPAYNELFPAKEESAEDLETKKSSTIQAAADAAADLYFDGRQSSIAAASREQVRDEVTKPHVGGNKNSVRQIRRIELREDRKLFFFWVCHHRRENDRG